MSQAINLAALAGRLLSGGLLPRSGISDPDGGRAWLGTSRTTVGTDIIVNGLDPDTLYAGHCVIIAAADGGFGWQSRFAPGGPWDTGSSDYANQNVVGAGSTAGASAGSNNYGAMGTKDGALPQLPVVAKFTLYTGSASRRAVMATAASFVSTDGVNAVAGALMSQRVANGAIADIRIISTATDGLAAGSRVFMQRIG